MNIHIPSDFRLLEIVLIIAGFLYTFYLFNGFDKLIPKNTKKNKKK